MNTTVILRAPADYGQGESDRVTIIDTEVTIADDGHLFLFRRGKAGTVGGFKPDEWRSFVRGDVVRENDRIEVKA